jgi:hypothetical protein
MTGYAWYAVSAFATALHREHWVPGTLRRILVVKTDHLGDFLLCLPAVRDFLATEPGAEVGFVVGSATRELASRVSWIREVHIFDSPRYVRIGRPSPEGTLESIFEKNWDLIIDLTNDRRSALAALSRPSRHRRDVGQLSFATKAGCARRRAAGASRGPSVLSRLGPRSSGPHRSRALGFAFRRSSARFRSAGTRVARRSIAGSVSCRCNVELSTLARGTLR